MNFFEAQASARRSTTVLVVLFLLAIFGLLALSNLLFYEFLFNMQKGGLAIASDDFRQVYDTNLSIMLSAAIVLFIILGSVYKLLQLSSGGRAIAESLGGVPVPRGSQEPQHRRILNIVEEMAIASGTPVPQVYLLNETGINAFAAGWKTTNAVIGITRGALETLNREELQGVIAHEFSHIFNGDMRLNLRLVAVLHGILMIGLMGRMIVHSLRHVRHSRNNRNSGQGLLAILAIGSALMIVGYSGIFFGGWIKALISRQREYLADASAVQFTRSASGIANALKKIGGSVNGSMLRTATADVYSHAYFSNSDTGISFLNFSTHPPLKQRIRRIQPNWDGRFIVPEKKSTGKEKDESEQDRTRLKVEQMAAVVAAAGSVEAATNAIDAIGNINTSQRERATRIQQELPEQIRQHAENPYGAQLLVLVILLDKSASLRAEQFSLIEAKFGQPHRGNAEKLFEETRQLSPELILPLIDIAMPTLREMTIEQYTVFSQTVKALINADGKVSTREWVIQRVVLQHLDESFGLRHVPVARYFVLGSAKHACETALSLIAYIEHGSPEEAMAAFNAGKKAIGAAALLMVAKKEISLKKLNAAMDELVLLKPVLKKRFLESVAACIAHDRIVTVRGYELMRAFASCMDCPLPPGIGSFES